MLFCKVAVLITLLCLPSRRNRRFRQYIRNGYAHAKALIQKKKYELTLACVRTIPFWRRRRDSNPRDVAAKRFSRPPRCDRFDTPPWLYCNFRVRARANDFSRLRPWFYYSDFSAFCKAILRYARIYALSRRARGFRTLRAGTRRARL